MKQFIYIFALLFSLLCVACKGERTPLPRSGEMTISGIDDTHWTYISLETGETVGRSTFLSTEEDALWAARNDWDIAVCGEFLRTNSGTSGNGKGGIYRNETTNFYNLTEAPAEGYTIDTDNQVVKR